jgi:hypothetical protein
MKYDVSTFSGEYSLLGDYFRERQILGGYDVYFAA